MSLDSFEKKIKGAMENYEFSHGAPDWSEFEQKLDAATTKNNYSGGIAAGIIGVCIGLLAIYMTQKPEVENNISTHQEKTSTQEIINAENTGKSVSAEVIAHKNGVSNNELKIDSSNNEAETDLETTVEKPTESLAEQHGTVEQKEKQHFSSAGTTDKSTELENNKGDLIAVKIMLSKEEACENEKIQFSTDKRCNCNYAWDFGDGNQSKGMMPEHIYPYSGQYLVQVSITSKSQPSYHVVETKNIKIASSPVTDFEIINPDWNNCESEHQFISKCVNASSYKWAIDGKIYSDNEGFNCLFDKSGKYHIVLNSENLAGCKGQFQKEIYVEQGYNLGASNAFTPNGDGIYDKWFPSHLKCLDYEFTLIISSREGKVVFQTSDKNKEWNGTIMGTGKTAQSGETFRWVATYVDKNGINRSASGPITIPPMK